MFDYLLKIYNKIRFEYRKPYERFIVYLYNKLFGTTKVIRKVFNNDMILDLKDEGISRKLFFSGVHEKQSTQQYIKNIRKGMNVLEIGANIGYYALIAADIIGKNGKVISFEPNPRSLKLLELNITLNNYTDIFEVFPYGVSNINRTCQFYIMNKGNTSSFIKRNDGDLKENYQLDVDVVCLDDYFSEDIRIDYFRMDIEGYEYNVIHGMKRILSSKDKPKGCFIEIHPKALKEKYNITAKDFILLLGQYEYQIEFATYRGLKSHAIYNNDDYFAHKFSEKDYWETFFIHKVG